MVQEASVTTPEAPSESLSTSQLSGQLPALSPNESARIMNNVLPPGQYLIEVQTFDRFELDPATLSKGLMRMGWTKVCPDVSDLFVGRFIGEIERPLVLQDTQILRWARVERIGAVDVFGELEYRLKPLEVKTGEMYELLFIARTKSHRTRKDVLKALEDMRFEVSALSLLKKDMRVPGYPGASAGLWFGFAFWRGPESYVNADDAFVFECVEPAISDQLVSTQPDKEEQKKREGEG
jgi:hypothetical protein